jgi:hypothetical protein
MVFIFPAPFRPNPATDINPYFIDQEKVKIKNALLMLASDRLRLERGGPYPHAKVLICYGPGLDPSILRHSGI